VCITVGSHTVVAATPTVGSKDTVSFISFLVNLNSSLSR